MKYAGEMLKEARESKNLSLHEIGMSLKINPKILQAIEDGDTTKLPQKTFLRGFIKSYAQYLRLDPNAVLKATDTASATTSTTVPTPVSAPVAAAPSTPTPPPTPSPAVESSPVQDLRKALADVKTPASVDRTARLDNLKTPAPAPRKGLYIILIVVLFAMVGVVARMVNKYQRERAVEKPAMTETAQLPVTDAATAPTPATEPAPAVTPTPAPTPAPEPAATTAKTTEIPATTLGIVPANILPPLPVIPKTEQHAEATVKPVTKEDAPAEKAAVTATTTTDTPAQTSEKSDVKPQEVIVEALNKVQIKSSLGDGKAESLELNADEIHTFKSKTLVHLEISDGGSVSLIVNGRDRGVPGKIGQPITIQYPK